VSFISEHAEVTATLISVLAAGWVLLFTALIKVKFGHIDDHQKHQDHRLGILEDDVSDMKGDRKATVVELRNLSSLLEKYFEEMEGYKKANELDHKEIKVDLKSLLRKQVG
jgi:hypothetical protein